MLIGGEGGYNHCHLTAKLLSCFHHVFSLFVCTQVQELIAGEYGTTQRIPTDPYQPLACHCFSRETARVRFSKRIESLNSECIDGYTVQLSSSLWAGLIPEDNREGGASQFPPSVPCPYNNGTMTEPIQDNLTDTVNQYRQLSNNSLVNFAPIDVVPYMGIVEPGGGAPVKCFQLNTSDVVTFEPTAAVFSIELCSQGYCRGDARSSWVVANESFPCAENRMGPLCGQCKPGYAVTLYSSVSLCHCRRHPLSLVLGHLSPLGGREGEGEAFLSWEGGREIGRPD